MAKTTRMKKGEAARLLGNVPEEYLFWCNDGRQLRNMKELAEALANMSDETFAYHSNAMKNDFSAWVRNIIKDEKLARDLDDFTSRTQAARIVADRVAALSAK